MHYNFNYNYFEFFFKKSTNFINKKHFIILHQFEFLNLTCILIGHTKFNEFQTFRFALFFKLILCLSL